MKFRRGRAITSPRDLYMDFSYLHIFSSPITSVSKRVAWVFNDYNVMIPFVAFRLRYVIVIVYIDHLYDCIVMIVVVLLDSLDYTLRWHRIPAAYNHKFSGIHHDVVIKWKYFLRYWPFVGGIHRLELNSQHKGQWRGALMFSLICTWRNGLVNNGEAGDLRRHLGHYDVTRMWDPPGEVHVSSPRTHGMHTSHASYTGSRIVLLAQTVPNRARL